MDGYTFTGLLRDQEPVGHHIPIIALTANAMRGEETRARAVGMDAYLTKPVRLKQLKEALMHWMPPSGQPDSAAAPSPTEVGDPAVLDVRVLEELVGAEREIVHDFLAQYRESARTIMAEIRAGHATDNLAQIEGATHRLKSSSRAIGALHFGDLCAHLESAAKQGKADDVAASLPPLELAFAAVERAIAQHLGTP